MKMESKSKLDKTWRETEEGRTVNNRKQMSANERGTQNSLDCSSPQFHGHHAEIWLCQSDHIILFNINKKKQSLIVVSLTSKCQIPSTLLTACLPSQRGNECWIYESKLRLLEMTVSMPCQNGQINRLGKEAGEVEGPKRVRLRDLQAVKCYSTQ